MQVAIVLAEDDEIFMEGALVPFQHGLKASQAIVHFYDFAS